MCGIVGFVGSGGTPDLAAMVAAVRHRGPDGEGIWIDSENAVHLGHTRLAILDAPGGAQPMWNEDRSICIIFNGEIYNHRTLRAALTRAGHVFCSDHSDTEVLVHGWEEWRFGLLDRLNGMFAFAIYDRFRRQLVLARDRMGEKPLFYAHTNESFVFGSELATLLRHPSLRATAVDHKALQKFFAYGFFPAPLTPYSGILKLPQGHALLYDVDRRQIELNSKYWRFRIEPDPPPGGERIWIEELQSLLAQAVAGRLESDVPLGIFLSGGIDSSTILSFAADRIPPSQINTFAIGFNEKSFDESGPAAGMAAHIGSHHRQHICDIGVARELIESLLPRIAEPLGDPSILPTYLLSQFVREHVTVALSGDGGDELFAGYDPFRALRLAQIYRAMVPRPVHRALELLAARLPLSGANMSFDFKLRRALRGLSFSPELWNPVWLGALAPPDLEELFNDKIDPEELYSEAIAAWDSSSSTSPTDRTLEFYTNLYLADDILVKTDRASMQVGLEVRSPFLDNDVVDFARRLPHNVKYRSGVTKWILRQAVAERLPASILSRAKKGFGIPLADWLCTMSAPDVTPPLPHLDEVWLRNRWHEHRCRRLDDRGALWCWLALRQGLGLVR